MDQTKPHAPLVPKFKDFEAMILYFNGMYKLPVAPYPMLEAEAAWQAARLGKPSIGVIEAVGQRLNDFFGAILHNELSEYHEIDLGSSNDLDILTDLADLLGDIIVYCASEMARYGIPQKEVLRIIMDSNFSKLDANGNPIYDENGKVSKGPFYWKPEPQIKALLQSMIEEHRNGPAAS